MRRHDHSRIDSAPPLIEGPDYVGADQVGDCQGDCVGQAERPVTGAHRSCVIGNRGCNRDRLATIDKIAGTGEPTASRCGRADQDLRT